MDVIESMWLRLTPKTTRQKRKQARREPLEVSRAAAGAGSGPSRASVRAQHTDRWQDGACLTSRAVETGNSRPMPGW